MTVKEKIDKQELVERLSDFKTSDQHYIHRISDSWRLMLSEGCYFVREAADAYWLFDLILSYQSSSALINVSMQSWNVKRVRRGQVQVLCQDRHGDILIAKTVKQRFVLDDLTVIVANNHAWLKSEYGNGQS